MDPECAVLGFNIVNPSIKDVALTKIGLERQPPTSMIMPLLSSSALQTPETAKQWFEVLAGRIAGEHIAPVTRMNAHYFCHHRLYTDTIRPAESDEDYSRHTANQLC